MMDIISSTLILKVYTMFSNVTIIIRHFYSVKDWKGAVDLLVILILLLIIIK